MIDLLDKDIQYLLKQENPSASGKKKKAVGKRKIINVASILILCRISK